ncbi:dual adapter for phosphotyrosine and 3-phosphotyrosine and 3-phosphoinositide-like [Haliotis rubra]|uniref:dual adapter for phosphotyrosine and 3-phosphotyrosine and 3-phosphoinositide-like n=1 Tax=Haliotis rubra TaxID=36100 RepID=UPI001EE57A4A|nr:dual adapter for phosphotyrosine and 3-phosphotyrosine and 3-phosphoinositide-like [Haliotis rubra]XP_046572835.1 dual adapter for phosphotyrosine and 3-phosphotyrosine and 3-phosphoinositide-like [Haliotis rubra]
MGQRIDELEKLSWFHPNLNRHTAESMLMQNANNGIYLLRASSKVGEYAISVRCDQSVKHFNLTWNGTEFKFGHGTFKTIKDLLFHFDNKPLIGGESGQLVLLTQPYPRDIEEPQMYEYVTVHAELSSADTNDRKSDFSINSKEGFLTKIGAHFKTWRTRWFVLQKHELKYYKQNTDKHPIRTLDLKHCTECSRDFSHKDKQYVFRLKFDWRTFYIYATSEQEMNEWMKVINWRLKPRT